jgi:para-aminobenzoate synthetase component 1
MLVHYARLFRFDHEERTIQEFVIPAQAGIHAVQHDALPDMDSRLRGNDSIKTLASNFTRAEYEQTVRNTLEQIAAGNFYQANITRKFFGRFAATPDYFNLFRRLCAASPAPYSAYIRHGDIAILSSSPETFLSIEGDSITSRPIKGSAPRGADEASDAAIRYALTTSAKNQAENLMIVDLMRHDLAHVSRSGSVKVTEHAALHSYATIHHLVSTIAAEKLPGLNAYDVARACFPPGSMTGAPKIAAMEWCAEQEKLERGVYSGALGWFGGNGCDLSVVIRTVIFRGSRFEFQVGGGIVADSTPTDEWQETLVKARGIAQALGIDEKQLAAL